MSILTGLTKCRDDLLSSIPKFYVDILRAFAEVNRLNVHGEVGQQRNIWASVEYPGVSKYLVVADIIEVADLPIKDSVIDYKCVQQKVQQTGMVDNVFLLCMALQKIFSSRLGCLPSNREFPTHLASGSKKLLAVQR